MKLTAIELIYSPPTYTVFVAYLHVSFTFHRSQDHLHLGHAKIILLWKCGQPRRDEWKIEGQKSVQRDIINNRSVTLLYATMQGHILETCTIIIRFLCNEVLRMLIQRLEMHY
jgi:hypothetical protein